MRHRAGGAATAAVVAPPNCAAAVSAEGASLIGVLNASAGLATPAVIELETMLCCWLLMTSPLLTVSFPAPSVTTVEASPASASAARLLVYR